MLPTMMKAVQFFEYGDPSVLKYIDVPVPPISDDEVLVKVKATSVNRFDLKMRRGQIPQIPGRDPFPMPFQPGRDMAGEVAAVGARVKTFKIGDRVVGMVHPACGQCDNCLKGWDNLCTDVKLPGHQTPGGYAEYVSRKETELLLAPDGVSWEKLGGCLWSYSTAWNIVGRRGDLKIGQSVLITGASGGVGTAVVQLCRLVGAGKIIATSGSPDKVARLKEIGVDHVVNYHDSNAIDQVRSLTGGKGVELAVDLVGDEMFLFSLKCLRMMGTIVLCAGEESKASIPVKYLSVVLSHTHVNIYGVRASKRIDQKTIIEFLGTGKIDPVIDCILPLSEAVKAHEIMENQEQVGKVVLIP